MSQRRKDQYGTKPKLRNFPKTATDEKAWLLDNPHEVEMS
jgi:hypothetical protein